MSCIYTDGHPTASMKMRNLSKFKYLPTLDNEFSTLEQLYIILNDGHLLGDQGSLVLVVAQALDMILGQISEPFWTLPQLRLDTYSFFLR